MRSHAKATSAGSTWTAAAATLVLAVALLALTASSAFAALGQPLLRTFSTGAGSNPKAIALDGNGNVYVLEPEAQRLARFDASGNPAPFSASGSYVKGNTLTGGPGTPFLMVPYTPAGLAIDNSGGLADGNVYVAAQGDGGSPYIGGRAYVFDSSGAYKGPLGGVGDYPCGVTVSQATGAVYVGDTNHSTVYRFDPPGANPAEAAPTGELHEYSCATAVDSTGAIYTSSIVRKYDASQFTAAVPVPSAEVESSYPSGLATDPANDDLYIDNGSQITKRDSAGSLLGAPFGALSSSGGLAVDPSGDVYATDSGGGVYVFGPDPVELPLASTGEATNVLQNSAHLEGNADPDSAGGIIGCEFRYGPDSGYSGGAVPCAPGASPGSPIASATTVTANPTGLTAGTTYHYRLFLTNANGTQAGADRTFITPPAFENVTTGGATEVAKDGADLTGSYLGDGQDVHYYFEYGTTTEYGQTAPAPPGNDAGTASGQQEVTPVHIGGLVGETTYHFRLVATNSYGSTRGQDETLTTAPAVTGLETEAASDITSASARLHGSFEADSNDTHYYFEWGPTVQYGQTVPAPPGGDMGSGSGRLEVPAEEIGGLQQGGTYHYRLVATNALGRTVGADVAFKTAEAPGVANLTSREVKATSAVLAAEINPHYGQTTYRFEWGASAAYGNSTPVPDASAGAANSPVPVSVALDGLSAGTTYHFRVVASNPYGTTASADQTFGFYPPACPNAQLRQETGSNGLPDCRAYELVTPSYAQGAVIFPLNGPNTGLATSPSKLAYSAAFGTFPEETGDPINSASDLYVSTRTDTGWYQKYIGRAGTETELMGGPPLNAVLSIFQGQAPSRSQLGTQVSPDMDRAINYDQGDPSINGQLGEASNAPWVWDTSSGKLLERWPTNLDEVSGGRDFVGVPQASPDFSHFVFSSNVVFAPGGEAFSAEIECCLGGPSSSPKPVGSVYDNDLKTGDVDLVSIREDGTTFRGEEIDISDDGSRILMAEGPETTKGMSRPLFLRVDDERTYDIAPGHEIHYVGGTSDGKTIYLTSNEQLTPDDHDTSTDLFMWREDSTPHLTRVSTGEGGEAGNSDNCLGTWTSKCDVGIISFAAYSTPPGGNGGNGVTDNFIAGKSGDIYFESPEQLLPAKGDPGRANLYVYRGGVVHFVAALDPEPLCTFGAYEYFCSDGPVARMQVTPDGSHMAFVTKTRLSAYDNAEHGEMYTYNPEGGGLDCVSCRPDGKPPVSDALGSQNGLFLTNDGRVFFSTQDPLIPQDTDGKEDVYEYTEGRAQMITNGFNPTYSGPLTFTGYQTIPGLVSVSANGTDVYFATLGNLVSQDHNGQEVKIYDARTGGGFPAERASIPCAAADECHGAGSTPPALPPDRTSASLGKPKAPAHRKAHKAKKHKHKRHKKKRPAKSRSKAGHHKQGGSHHG